MEIWKDIPGYGGQYQVSNLGIIKSLKNGRYGIGKETILKTAKSYNGYSHITLQLNGKQVNHSVHRLVAITFIPNPLNLPVVMHLDNDPSNNSIDNLKWGTHKENTQQCWNEGRENNKFSTHHSTRGKFGKDNPKSKRVYQYTRDGKFIKEWYSAPDVYRETRIDFNNISACCRGKLKSAGGFIWRY